MIHSHELQPIYYIFQVQTTVCFLSITKTHEFKHQFYGFKMKKNLLLPFSQPSLTDDQMEEPQENKRKTKFSSLSNCNDQKRGGFPCHC